MRLAHTNVQYIFTCHTQTTNYSQGQKKNSLKIRNVERLTYEAVDLVSKSDWEKCVEHVGIIRDEETTRKRF